MEPSGTTGTTGTTERPYRQATQAGAANKNAPQSGIEADTTSRRITASKLPSCTARRHSRRILQASAASRYAYSKQVEQAGTASKQADNKYVCMYGTKRDNRHHRLTDSIFIRQATQAGAANKNAPQSGIEADIAGMYDKSVCTESTYHQ